MKLSSGMVALIMGMLAGFAYLWLAFQSLESGKFDDALLWVTAGAFIIAGMLLTQRTRKSSCNAKGNSSSAPR